MYSFSSKIVCKIVNKIVNFLLKKLKINKARTIFKLCFIALKGLTMNKSSWIINRKPFLEYRRMFFFCPYNNNFLKICLYSPLNASRSSLCISSHTVIIPPVWHSTEPFKRQMDTAEARSFSECLNKSWNPFSFLLTGVESGVRHRAVLSSFAAIFCNYIPGFFAREKYHARKAVWVQCD